MVDRQVDRSVARAEQALIDAWARSLGTDGTGVASRLPSTWDVATNVKFAEDGTVIGFDLLEVSASDPSEVHTVAGFRALVHAYRDAIIVRGRRRRRS